MGSRRTLSRELALQALYQHDVASGTDTPITSAHELDAFLRNNTDDPRVFEYARTIVHGTLALQDQIDQRIARVAANWRLERIAAVDRCVLRLALYELLEVPEVPPKVAINEAIELAKKFSTEQSGAFVNGLLDRAYRGLVEEFGRGGASQEGDPVEVS